MKKRMTSLILAIILISAFPAIAFADETVPAESIMITGDASYMYVGDTRQLKAQVSPPGEYKILWMSTKTEIAAVSQDGTVTARGIGKATIRASVNMTMVTTSFDIEVIEKRVESIMLSKQIDLLLGGTSSSIRPIIKPHDATNQDVTYFSNNKSVATVDASGRITGVSLGSAVITVRVDGIEDTCLVNVILEEPDIDPSPESGKNTPPTPSKSAAQPAQPSITPKNPSATDVPASTTAEAHPSASSDITATAAPVADSYEWSNVQSLITAMQPEGKCSVNMQGQTQIPLSVLSALKTQRGVLEIDFGDYSCIINGNDLFVSAESTSFVDLGMSTYKDESLSEAIGEIDVYQLHFKHHGQMPGRITYKIMATKNQAGDTLYLYYYYDDSKVIQGLQALLVDDDGFVTFDIDHCSVYFLSDTAIGNFSKADQISDNKAENTVSSGIPLYVIIIAAFGGSIITMALLMYFFKVGLFKKRLKKENIEL